MISTYLTTVLTRRDINLTFNHKPKSSNVSTLIYKAILAKDLPLLLKYLLNMELNIIEGRSSNLYALY